MSASASRLQPFWSAGLLALVAAAPAWAVQEPGPGAVVAQRQLRVQGVSGTIRIDGDLTDAAWQKAEVSAGFWQPLLQRRADDDTEIRLLRDGTTLYVAIRAFDSQPAAIAADQQQPNKGFDRDDALTLQFDPALTQNRLVRFGVNAIGTLNQSTDGLDQVAPSRSWRAAVRRKSWGWSAELAIPWVLINVNSVPPRIGFNVVRYHRRRGEVSEWAHRTTQQLPRDLGRLLFDVATPQPGAAVRSSPHTLWRPAPVGLRGVSPLAPVSQMGVTLAADQPGRSTTIGILSVRQAAQNQEQLNYRERLQFGDTNGLVMAVNQQNLGDSQQRELMLSFDGEHQSGWNYNLFAALSNPTDQGATRLSGKLGFDRDGWSLGAQVSHTLGDPALISATADEEDDDDALVASQANAWLRYQRELADGWLRAVSAGFSGRYGLSEGTSNQALNAFLSAELRQAQLRLRLEGSMASSQGQVAPSGSDCLVSDVQNPCDQAVDSLLQPNLNTLRVSLEGGTRHPWFSYGITHSQSTNGLDNWSLTTAQVRIKASSLLRWNLGMNYSDQTEILQQSISASWVLDPRSGVTLGLTHNSDLGLGVEAGYEWKLLHQLELNTALRASQDGTVAVGLWVLIGF